jgi:uncharacterized protein
MLDHSHRHLERIFAEIGSVAVAVSGGVDSLTLATVAFSVLDDAARMFHAVSPAVPEEATQRTQALAKARGWSLELLDAGEYADADYRANPVNRCFFCKNNLYGALAQRTRRQIVSGTNLDDLGDYRPGLDAARQYGVRHPFVEAEIDKHHVRSLAAKLGLREIAELPAAPCLSSRIETGIRIEAPMLAMVHRVEKVVSAAVPALTVRCRFRRSGVVVELDAATLEGLEEEQQMALRRQIAAMLAETGLLRDISFAPYRTGSAFLRDVHR